MAGVMAATYPDVYTAVGVHSGLPYRSATDVVSAFAAMRGDAGLPGRQRRTQFSPDHAVRPRTIVFHGDADHIVHHSNGTKITDGYATSGDSVERVKARSSASRTYTRSVTRDKTGTVVVEQWLIHGSGHAWSGGSPDGTYTDPHGPDASREMLRFFFSKSRRDRGIDAKPCRSRSARRGRLQVPSGPRRGAWGIADRWLQGARRWQRR